MVASTSVEVREMAGKTLNIANRQIRLRINGYAYFYIRGCMNSLYILTKMEGCSKLSRYERVK